MDHRSEPTAAMTDRPDLAALRDALADVTLHISRCESAWHDDNCPECGAEQEAAQQAAPLDGEALALLLEQHRLIRPTFRGFTKGWDCSCHEWHWNGAPGIRLYAWVTRHLMAEYARLAPARPADAALPWDHAYESGKDSMACLTCGFVGSYAHTEQFYRKWVFPALAQQPTPAEGEGEP